MKIVGDDIVLDLDETEEFQKLLESFFYKNQDRLLESISGLDDKNVKYDARRILLPSGRFRGIPVVMEKW